MAGPHPDGDRWCGRTVGVWLSERLGRQVSRQLGWRYPRRLGAHWLKPRPHHVRADPQAQADFKQHLRPLLRQVAMAFPQATVELWAVDEHRIGLKPILHKAWTLPTFQCRSPQRPSAPGEHRYEWRYLVGFAHPASGRTVFHLLLLPGYSPKSHPAEHLCALTNTALANRHFASIDELEDTQAARCITLQARPDLIRSTTLFYWWPRQIRRRQGPPRE
jgi:hypothetical protein